ncbi:MAG: hypothetical protein ACYS8W_18365 [Planctomycetota bacterium]|jgi:hypothetical protein
MKLSLPLKLGILVVVIFGITIAAMLLYKPFKIRWYESKLDSGDVETRRQTVEKLLALGDGGKAALENGIIGRDHTWVMNSVGNSLYIYPLPSEPDMPAGNGRVTYSVAEYILIFEKFIIRFDMNSRVIAVHVIDLPANLKRLGHFQLNDHDTEMLEFIYESTGLKGQPRE